MDISSCRICSYEFLSCSSSVYFHGINICIYLWCSIWSRGITIIKYFITDPSFSLFQTFNAIRQFSPTFVCYRNKHNPSTDEITKFIEHTKKYSKTFINFESIPDKKIIKYFDGIHFPSKFIEKLSELKKEYPNHIFITSTHSIEEVKKSLLSDYITFSPIFNSKGRVGLGIEVLNKVCEIHPNVIALGGIINDKEIEKVKNSKAVGFASIRYFYST